jgi:secondary thiamine-phosphate synthase enzyme
MFQSISVATKKRTELVDITDDIVSCIKKSKVKQGLICVFCPHTTAAITINENCDPSVQTDITNILSKLIPQNAGYAHTEGNADAHAKAAVVGSSRLLFIEEGNVLLGRWQGIFLCEFDGPRTREVRVKITKD